MVTDQSGYKKWGPIQALETGGSGPLCIILFHGFGADAHDLAPLSREVSAPPGARWLFPSGPLKVPIAPGMMGRAWFPIDTAALQRSMMSGQGLDLSRVRPPGLTEVRDKALQFIKELEVDPSQLILGGFSQGAMLALEICMEMAVPPRAMVLLSATLLDRFHWQEKAGRHEDLPYFQSHGRQDTVLAYGAAEELHELLTSAGWIGDLHSFSGGHEIPYGVLQKLGQFLNSQR